MVTFVKFTAQFPLTLIVLEGEHLLYLMNLHVVSVCSVQRAFAKCFSVVRHVELNRWVLSDKRLSLETSAFEYLYGGQFTLSIGS